MTERILQAIAAAQAELATLIRQSSLDTFGEDSDQAKLVSDSLETRLRSGEVLGPDETR